MLKAHLRIRLSVMMYLHYLSLGVFAPILGIHLYRDLGLGGAFTGLVLAAGALASLVSPLLAAPLVARRISGEHFLGWLNLGSALCLIFMAATQNGMAILVLYTLMMFFKGPTIALTNSVTFRHLPDIKRQFPPIRVWGTFGWFSAGWILIFFLGGPEALSQQAETLPANGSAVFSGLGTLGLSAGALVSLVLAIYSFTLPQGPRYSPSTLKPSKERWAAFFRYPGFVALLAAALVMTLVDRFYFFGTGLVLGQEGLSDAWLLPIMSLGQGVELLVMPLMAFLLPRLGYRKVFLVGIFWQLVRFALLALAGIQASAALPLLFLGIASHGLCFGFFHTNSFIFIDEVSTPEDRAQLHQFYSFILEGVGVVLGNLLAGWYAGILSPGREGWLESPAFWYLPLGLTLFVFVLVFFLFHPRKHVPLPKA